MPIFTRLYDCKLLIMVSSTYCLMHARQTTALNICYKICTCVIYINYVIISITTPSSKLRLAFKKISPKNSGQSSRHQIQISNQKSYSLVICVHNIRAIIVNKDGKQTCKLFLAVDLAPDFAFLSRLSFAKN